ncbi:uncharacterized protein BCR38DRAFT_333307 [Pseudomassariella vexata]|uniref:EH domain-containing protein n=1 Tax=Pseudomassariella vexata TaxID=1141098 RepID=A0A1Y2EFG2_9PEZI|nr:uncharacterized protein BCR38DRAFT_333307 [Pseudomassariella vexata]ORY70044.1 hypothetical protein BCR38DRAFT_333307 [Pseudomassariella vexata]
MAGILASSRATPSSTALTPPPPPSRRQTPHMRQTLRQLPSKSDDEASRPHKHRKKPLGGHKKHSHHEGARRRWREEITARERKRYEGVWASNRGLFLNSSSPDDARTSELVANVVVRDIWARSRLPVDELAEVWDLVDHQHNGALDKADFVVGMWLIDQRLRGRKLPQKVGDSVWESATGVKVPGPRGRKKK